jgi:HEAT repeat protein
MPAMSRSSAALLCLFAVACAGPRDSVPALMKALRSPKPEVRAEAARKLGEKGDEARPALPALLSALEDRHSSVYRAAAGALASLGAAAAPGLAGLAGHSSAWVRCRAVETLGRLPASAETVPLLVRALQDHDACVHDKAVEALGRAGTPAVAPVVALLKNPNPAVRRGASEALGRMDADIRERAAFPLLQDLRGKDEYVRGEAELLLSEMGAAVAPSVVSLLSDPDADLRRRAVVILGRVARAEDEVVAGLAGRLVDPNRVVRLKAALALGEIGERDDRMLPALLSRLSQAPDPAVRRGLVEAVGNMGPAAKTAVGRLILLLSDEDAKVREEASESLMKVGTFEAMDAAERHNRQNLK